MFRTGHAVVMLIGIWSGMHAAPARAEETPPSGLERTVEALKARVRDQDRRIAELEDQQSKTVRAADVRKLVDEAVGEMGPSNFRLYWDNGMRAKTADGSVSMKFGGRLMYDWTWYDDDQVEEVGLGEVSDSAEPRRARLYWQGSFNKRISFKVQYDFTGGDADFKDAYLELNQLPVVQNLRFGHFKEPFALNEPTSSKYILFIERSLPNAAFAPGRNVGAMIHGTLLDERMTLAGGVFRDADDFGQSGQFIGAPDDEQVFTGRVTVLPWYEQDGKRLLHLGGATSYRHLKGNDNAVRVRTRPETHVGPRLVDTNFGPIDIVDAEDINLFGGEIAMVLGSFHWQAEYMAAMVESNLLDDAFLDGWYVQAGYFLTGEHRPYKKSEGAFSRVKPLKPYDKGGPGAIELKVRYSTIDLDDAGLTGGSEENISFGVNWYLTGNVRLMADLVRVMANDVNNTGRDADGCIFIIRAQVDF